MIVENGIRIEDVIQSIKLYDCMYPEYWVFVSEFFGSDLPKNDELNQKITEVIQGLFWFHSMNGLIFLTDDEGSSLQYFVENGKTKYLLIAEGGKKLWELKL